jgi:hypothetical protein
VPPTIAEERANPHFHFRPLYSANIKMYCKCIDGTKIEIFITGKQFHWEKYTAAFILIIGASPWILPCGGHNKLLVQPL